jgi:glyoxalase superfamily protein
MATRLVQIAMNTRDDAGLCQFWAEALGWSVSSEEPGGANLKPVGFTYPDPVAVCIDILAVPEPKTVNNRVHIDLATTSVAHQGPGRTPAGSRCHARRRGPGRRPVDGPGRPVGLHLDICLEI